MVTYEQIEAANSKCTPTMIKEKAYMDVAQRIKAFRMVYPDGFIISDMLSNENGVCIFKSEVGFYTENGEPVILSTGMAYEKEGSTFINKTSYIENAETSAVGRALGMAGFGVDTSVASADEVQNAMANQGEQKQEQKEERKATPKQIEFLAKTYTGENLEKLLKANNITKLDDLSITKASDLIKRLGGKK